MKLDTGVLLKNENVKKTSFLLLFQHFGTFL